MSNIYGWWEFDFKNNALLNAKTGQRVTNEGRIKENDGSTWNRIRYSDREIEFEVYTRQEQQIYSDPFNEVIVDYEKSACAWRSSGHGKVDNPSYGMWRRIDACLTEAILIWPVSSSEARVRNRASIKGGWCNGEWKSDFSKLLNCTHLGDQYDPVTPPPLVRLDEPPPPTWSFVDIPVTRDSATINGLTRSKAGKLALPAELPLTGFEKTMPHLIRGDGKAIILPGRVDQYFFRGEDFRTRVFLLYADEHIVFGATLDHRGFGWEFCYWNVALSLSFRNEDIDDELKMIEVQRPKLESQQTEGSDPYWTERVLSKPMWDRICNALIDGFSCWKPTKDVKIHVDAEKVYSHVADTPAAYLPNERQMHVDLRGLSGVCIEGAYIGGILNTKEVSQCFGAARNVASST